MNTKSEVLKKFKHLLEVKYTGKTPASYLYQVSLFLDFCDKPPENIVMHPTVYVDLCRQSDFLLSCSSESLLVFGLKILRSTDMPVGEFDIY